MKNTNLLEEIGNITSILDGHIERLMKNPGQMHEIDIDLMSGKLKEIYAEIDQLEKTKIEQKQYVRYTELAPYFMAVALGLLLAEVVLSRTRLQTIP